MSELTELKNDTKDIKSNIKKFELMKLSIFNEHNLFTKNDIEINGKFWNYIEILLNNLDERKFKGYFNKTVLTYVNFKSGNILTPIEVSDYFRRCQFLSILEVMVYLPNYLPISNNTCLIKIGPSKNDKKNCTLIDDSTVIDKDTKEIRDTNGTIDEPHRGFKMFNILTSKEKLNMINIFDYVLCEFSNILKKIKDKDYILFDPINILQRIINYASKNNLVNLIYMLSCEVHDTSYLLTTEEQIKLFDDSDNLYKLWNDEFITSNHGKLRIFILSLYFINLISDNKINE
jgi:hypothetical protein